MEKIGSYGSYQSNIYEQTRTAANTSRTAAAKNAEAAKSSNKVELSSAAKKLLKELHNTYGDTDFMVASYETEEEAASYLSRGTGTYSVLLTPEELEKMAADEDYKKKNLQTLDDAVAKLKDMKDQLGDKGEDVKRVGVAIGDDGQVSYFAELEKSSENQRERIEKQRAEKKEEAVKEEKKAAKEKAEERYSDGSFIREGTKRTTLFADSVKELQDKIGAFDWSAVREDGYGSSGSRFDFTV
ncbi:MAG: DUF6033 family protein [Butyrivibrio sp.]|nr:DUF6033 family protein [Acetatifactor muris]MCM1559392.1 DUF6033 family protein [Butyrivibrio sp.]